MCIYIYLMKYLILDLDETLIYSIYAEDDNILYKDCDLKFKLNEYDYINNKQYYVYLRPNIIIFLSILYKYYKIIIYTNATYNYTMNILYYINYIVNNNTIPLFVTVYYREGNFYKLKSLKNKFDINNCIIIDDNVDVWDITHYKIIFKIPKFNLNLNKSSFKLDNILLLLLDDLILYSLNKSNFKILKFN